MEDMLEGGRWKEGGGWGEGGFFFFGYVESGGGRGLVMLRAEGWIGTMFCLGGKGVCC